MCSSWPEGTGLPWLVGPLKKLWTLGAASGPLSAALIRRLPSCRYGLPCPRGLYVSPVAVLQGTSSGLVITCMEKACHACMTRMHDQVCKDAGGCISRGTALRALT